MPGRWAGTAAEDDQERREHEAVYDGWWGCETLEDVEEHERMVNRWAKRNPGTVNQSDAAIARAKLKMVRKSIKHHGGPW